MKCEHLGKVPAKVPDRGPTLGEIGQIVVYVRRSGEWPNWTKLSETEQIKLEFHAGRGVWKSLNFETEEPVKYPVDPNEYVGVIEQAPAWV